MCDVCSRRSILKMLGASSLMAASSFSFTRHAAAATQTGAVADRVLLRGGTLVTMEPGGDFQGDLLIENGKIAAMGANLQVADAEIIDATGMTVMPGLIDTHRHTWQTALRGMGVDWTFEEYFGAVHMKLAPRYRPEDTYAGNLLGAISALDSGVTTLVDWSHNLISPQHVDGAIQGLRDAGIRAVFAQGPANEIWRNREKYKDTAYPREEFDRVRKHVLSSDDSLVTMALASREPGWQGSPTAIAKDFAMARVLGIRITMHVISQDMEWKRYPSIRHLHELGALGPDITHVHCTWVEDDEIEMIKDTGGTVSIAPSADARLTGMWGSVPTGRLLERGVRPSLSVDSETGVSGDMFIQMRTAFDVEKAIINSKFEPRKEGATLRAHDVLDFATVQGAKAVGMENRIGSLRVGKQADILVLRQNDLNLFPSNDPLGAVVVSAHPGNIDMTFVNGKMVKRNGQLLVADVEKAKRAVEESRAYLLAN